MVPRNLSIAAIRLPHSTPLGIRLPSGKEWGLLETELVVQPIRGWGSCWGQVAETKRPGSGRLSGRGGRGASLLRLQGPIGTGGPPRGYLEREGGLVIVLLRDELFDRGLCFFGREVDGAGRFVDRNRVGGDHGTGIVGHRLECVTALGIGFAVRHDATPLWLELYRGPF